MSRSTSLTPITNADFDAIEAAVLETARGRWFLAEYARRNRHADTDVLLGAIGKLEKALVGERAAQDIDRVRFDLSEMAKAISRAKVEIAAIRPVGRVQSRFEEATEALDAIVRTTERATSDILEAAEHIQEAAWTLREAAADDSLCDILDKRATDIYTACTFQDLTAQRTTRIIEVMRYLEGRINAMIDAFGRTMPEETAPYAGDSPGAMVLSLNTAGLSQSDIDLVIVDEEARYALDPGGAQGPDIQAPDIQAPDMAERKDGFDKDGANKGSLAQEVPGQQSLAEGNPARPAKAGNAAGQLAPAATASASASPAPASKTLVGNDLMFVARVDDDADKALAPVAAEAMQDAAAPHPETAAEQGRHAAFAAIDQLDELEKLRRFT